MTSLKAIGKAMKERSFAMVASFHTEATGVVLHLLRQKGLEPDQMKDSETATVGLISCEWRYVSHARRRELQTWIDAAQTCGLIHNAHIAIPE